MYCVGRKLVLGCKMAGIQVVGITCVFLGAALAPSARIGCLCTSPLPGSLNPPPSTIGTSEGRTMKHLCNDDNKMQFDAAKGRSSTESPEVRPRRSLYLSSIN